MIRSMRPGVSAEAVSPDRVAASKISQLARMDNNLSSPIHGIAKSISRLVESPSSFTTTDGGYAGHDYSRPFGIAHLAHNVERLGDGNVLVMQYQRYERLSPVRWMSKDGRYQDLQERVIAAGIVEKDASQEEIKTAIDGLFKMPPTQQARVLGVPYEELNFAVLSEEQMTENRKLTATTDLTVIPHLSISLDVNEGQEESIPTFARHRTGGLPKDGQVTIKAGVVTGSLFDTNTSKELGPINLTAEDFAQLYDISRGLAVSMAQAVA